MELWRISNFPDLSGVGGRLAAGRWHRQGSPIVYCADHPALALVEVLVHIDADLVPTTYQWLRIHVPDRLAVTVVDQLPEDDEHCQLLGQSWLDRAATPILSVPSVIVPSARNFLLNPLHSDHRRARIVERIQWPFDARLARR